MRNFDIINYGTFNSIKVIEIESYRTRVLVFSLPTKTNKVESEMVETRVCVNTGPVDSGAWLCCIAGTCFSPTKLHVYIRMCMLHNRHFCGSYFWQSPSHFLCLTIG